MSRPVLLIAGGSRGIGAATAKLAGARGYDVAVNYHSNVKAADSVVASVKAAGGNAEAIQGDIARESEIERVFEQAAKLGPLTHLVHSAGITGKNSRLDVADTQTIREVLDVNVFGALLFARGRAPHVDQARR
jgi:NAD(P)-dependent dehydrogenase (short-subunit alcohol dehydrogenase family)